MSKKDFVANFVKRILREQSGDKNDPTGEGDPKKKKPKKKRKKHAAGEIVVGYGAGKGSGGRFLGSVNEAGALARDNPKGLMDNLGVKSGGSGLNGALTIINAAISGTPAMKRAYAGANQVKSGGKSAVFINSGEINSRNGANLLHHVLVGAQRAGIFNASEAVQIQAAGNKIVVHLSPYKNSWEG